jgi:hypothetical protein
MQQRDRCARLLRSFVDLSQSFGNCERWIIGRRKHLQSFDNAILHPHAIGERTSGIDCDADFGMKFGIRTACHDSEKTNREDYHCSRPVQQCSDTNQNLHRENFQIGKEPKGFSVL